MVMQMMCGVVSALVCSASVRAEGPAIEMLEVPGGAFAMGGTDGDWDEQPVHEVTLTGPVRISAKRITLDQYRRFRPDHDCADPDGSVTGVTWHDAMAFCAWLAEQEGKPYRLPTEAEWEYLCRTRDNGQSTGALEWCLDWYGEYPAEAQTDPVGAVSGLLKVIRGNKLDKDSRFELAHTAPPYYLRAANRSAMPPAFGVTGAPAAGQEGDVPGRHAVGFRVVQAPMPQTAPWPVHTPFVCRGVKARTAELIAQGPDPATPYYRKRYLLPTPPETIVGFVDDAARNRHYDAILAAGFHPAFAGHHHSPAFEVCPNGDLLAVFFSSWNEYEPGMCLVATRLRYGAEQWDMPKVLIATPDACDNAPLLWRDGDALHLFFAHTQIAQGDFPFSWITSMDSGATWSEVRFPHFTTPIGPHSRQPINTALRDKDGTIYVPSDGEGGSSVLWTSRDNMQTWQDFGGRTGGRHTTFVLLADGVSILGLGGKNTDINGYMPQSISRDGGRTWEVSATPFPALAANQRPCVLRLQSGRLLFASDFQKREGISPDGVTERGSFVAVSEDDGATWRIKKLAGTQPHEEPDFHKGADTIGYSVMRQAPDGTIHLITTMNRPCLHFAFNEAWVLSDVETPDDDAILMAAQSDGRPVLDGPETWTYPDGRKQYEATYRQGMKVGTETLWREDGSTIWQWEHGSDGTSRWTQYWPNGTKKAESTWRNHHAEGPARTWNRDGSPAREAVFENGVMQ